MLEDEKRIGYEVKQLSCLIRYDFETQLSQQEVGVTCMQAWIIGYLSRSGQTPVYQRDLEHEFQIRGSSVTSLLKLMEKNGLIVRSRVSHDARLKRLELTPKAIEIHRKIQESIRQHEERLRTGLTEEEVAVFFSVVHKIKQNLL